MSKWTPGPWEIGNDGYNADHIYFGANKRDKTSVCQVFGIPMHTRIEEVNADRYANGLANARLISEAPAMAELLAYVVQRDSECYRPDEASGALGSLAQDARALLERINK